ncbi:MAG TPA: hypothetical protein VFN10_18155 [Thermoanaerobaculia bacterium]|nr:hypothetical protein [Thermoanaerobaculia bacterium]
MKVRTLLTMTALTSSILGAIIVYLVLTVPNDLKADAMMKDARKQIAAGDHVKARAVLSDIVQQYPRTDAAAAATVALVSIGSNESTRAGGDLDALRKRVDQQAQVIAQLQQQVTELKNAPPKIVTVEAPAPKPPPKKAPAKKRTTSKRRRR